MLNIKKYNLSLLDDLVSISKMDPRSRKSFNLHEHYFDSCQKIINAINEDSYIAPHRHVLDPKTETLLAISGCFALIIFDNKGIPIDTIKFGAKGCPVDSFAYFGVDIPPDAWHTIIALQPNSVLLEIKAGPFNPSMAKEFAPWAPLEGSSESAAYLKELKSLAF